VTPNLALTKNAGLINSTLLISDESSMFDGADRTISPQDATPSDTPLATPVTEIPSAIAYPDIPSPTIMEADSISSPSTASPATEFSGAAFPFPSMTRESLSVLVAEDNPINAKLLHKRLLKAGHRVEIAYDGQACHDQFTGNPLKVDVILMDLQMPLVDGAMSTRMIRHYEKTFEKKRRVPIIAVSASLIESSRFDYIESGFDAWILKPIDFSRLDFLLQGIKKPEIRQLALYVPGKWEMGGWFLP